MKKFKFSLIAILLTGLLFALSPAKAQSDPGTPCGGSDIDSPCAPSGGSDSGAPGLPIDNNIWFLVGAATLIGTKAITKKLEKKQVPAPVKLVR